MDMIVAKFIEEGEKKTTRNRVGYSAQKHPKPKVTLQRFELSSIRAVPWF